MVSGARRGIDLDRPWRRIPPPTQELSDFEPDLQWQREVNLSDSEEDDEDNNYNVGYYRRGRCLAPLRSEAEFKVKLNLEWSLSHAVNFALRVEMQQIRPSRFPYPISLFQDPSCDHTKRGSTSIKPPLNVMSPPQATPLPTPLGLAPENKTQAKFRTPTSNNPYVKLFIMKCFRYFQLSQKFNECPQQQQLQLLENEDGILHEILVVIADPWAAPLILHFRWKIFARYCSVLARYCSVFARYLLGIGSYNILIESKNGIPLVVEITFSISRASSAPLVAVRLFSIDDFPFPPDWKLRSLIGGNKQSSLVVKVVSSLSRGSSTLYNWSTSFIRHSLPPDRKLQHFNDISPARNVEQYRANTEQYRAIPSKYRVVPSNTEQIPRIFVSGWVVGPRGKE
ncbi:hypothetical protein MA16_Dca007609 [Dendrobium catenatum]|uniref:Uncharacterized protein n=1 Tax=Dendrobium catenatum TaxID=906689 RepID=A0A2I0X0R0_9ASPA|nr:hypothetical protein MA16_Dca007609 [Dendrobium catenatum]